MIGALLLCALLQNGGLAGRLAAGEASTREAATRELATREDGPWVDRILDLAPRLPDEARRRLATGLGANRRLLEHLCRRAGAGDPVALAALERHYDLHRLPPPANPDQVAVIPDVPLRIEGDRDLRALAEALVVHRVVELPLLFDPRLDLAPPALSVFAGDAAYSLAVLLPPPSGPGPAITRIAADGLAITVPGGAPVGATAFTEALRLLSRTDAHPVARRRAAWNLGALDLPTLPKLLERWCEDAELGDLAAVALAVSVCRGLTPSPRAIAAIERAFRRRPQDRLATGLALRSVLARELAAGRVPRWLVAERWPDAALYAKLPSGPLTETLERIARDERGPLRVRACALTSLALGGGGPRLAPYVAETIRRGAWTKGDARALRAVVEAYLPWAHLDPVGEISPDALRGSYEAGRAIARWLGAQGRPGLRAGLGLLGELGGDPAGYGLLELAAAPEFGLADWRRAHEHGNPEIADLLLGEARGLEPRQEELRAVFTRLRSRLSGAGRDPRVDRALGRALAMVLRLSEAPLFGRDDADWCVAWLEQPRTERVALAAMLRIVLAHPLFARDVVYALARRRIDPAQRMRMIGLIDLVLAADPPELGRPIGDPFDPLRWAVGR